MLQNEIADFLERAPKKGFSYNGAQILNHAPMRYKWLYEISRGTIHERINRRAGITDIWIPWKNPVLRAINRNKRKQLKSYYLNA
jgi:hypothetical protein